jgi:predicted amidohydrolase
MIRIAVIQFTPVQGCKEHNLDVLGRMIELADADIFVLPELCTTGYFFLEKDDLADLAEDSSGPAARFFRKTAMLKKAFLIAGMAEQSGSSLFNSVFVFNPAGSEPLVYRKSHLFYKESLIFEPGDTGFPVLQSRVPDVSIGIMLCYDWRFPEAARVLALEGADIIACPSNLITDAWKKVMPARAIENKVYVAVANRAGAESRNGEKLVFKGCSALYDPYGAVVLQGDAFADAVLVAEIDPMITRDKSFNAYNDIFRDRRPEFYGRICRDLPS